MTNRLSRIDTAAVALVGAVYLLLILAFPSGFWIIDEGNKFIWARNFIQTGAFVLEDHAEGISPGHSTFKPPFSNPSPDGAGEITTFSPVFITLISPLVKLGGLRLALLIPLIVSILLILETRRLAFNFKLPFKWHSILILGLASPLLFYSITLWEHGLAVLLGLLAVNLALSKEPGYGPRFLAGALLAVSIYIRPEMGIFALAAWIFLAKDRITMLLGGVGGLVVMALLNWAAVQSLLPLQITSNFALRWEDLSLGDYLLARLDSFYALILEGSHIPYLAAGLIAAAAMFFLLPGVFKFILPVYLIVLVIVSWFDAAPFFHIGNRSSLLFTAPFFITGLALKPKIKQWSSLKRAVIFTAVLTALATPVFRGIHYGPRLLLPVIPFLAVLSTAYLFEAYKKREVFKFDALLFLIIAQVMATSWGITLLEGRRSANQERTETLLAQTKHSVVTLQWWLTQEIPEIQFTRNVYLTETLLDFKVMLIDYYKEGVRFFTLLTRENESSKILDFFNAAPPKQIGAFAVQTGYPSLDLVGMHYAIGFGEEGAAELADELGVYFGQIEGDLNKAERYLRNAAAWDNKVGKYHYNLGYCLGMQGRYYEALEEIEIAGDLEPEDKRISRMVVELNKKLRGAAEENE